MTKKIAVLYGLLSLCFYYSTSANQLNISGNIITWDSSAVAGAKVKMLKSNLETTTDQLGRFFFTDSGTTKIRLPSPYGFKPTLLGGILRLSIVSNATIVSVQVLSLQGKNVQTVFYQQMNIGNYQLSLPSNLINSLGIGVYIVKLSIGKSIYSFKYLNKKQGSRIGSSAIQNILSISSAMNKRMLSDSLNDTIVISKSGYDTTIQPLSLYTQVFSNTVLYLKTVINSNAKVVSLATNQNLVAIDSNSLVFKINDTTISSYKVGDILISDMNVQAPNGYLRKITSIQYSGNQVLFTTENATMEDVFASAHASFRRTFTDTDIIGTDTSSDTAFGLNKKAIAINPGTFKFSYKKTFFKEGVNELTVEGGVDLKPTFNFDIVINNKKVDRFLLSLTTENTGSLDVAYTAKLPFIHAQMPLRTWQLAPITILVGGIIPIPIAQHWFVLVVGIDGTISAKLEAQATYTSTGESGILWSKNTWTPIFTGKNSFSSKIPMFTAEASIEPWDQIRYEMRPFALPSSKIFIGINASIKADAALRVQTVKPDTLDWSLEFGAKAFANAQIQGWGNSLVAYQDTLYKNYFPISKGKLPIGLLINKTTDTLTIGTTEQLLAIRLPLNDSNKNVLWNSSDFSTVSVSNSGLISGIKNGTAIINVATVDSLFSAQCTVSVIDVSPPTTTTGADGTYILGGLRGTVTDCRDGIPIAGAIVGVGYATKAGYGTINPSSLNFCLTPL